MPPHVGHAHLIASARPLCKTLLVLVCTLPEEPIPGELRYAWMQEIAAPARVLHVDQRIPGAERENPGAPQIWAKAIRDIVGVPISAVFASESYGAELATNLDATYVPVDPDREAIPISASRIREHPIRYWHYLPGEVRPWYVRRIAIADAPGASELARTLGRHLETVAVPWYRQVYAAYGPQTTAEGSPGSTGSQGNLEQAMQRASEDAAARRSNGTLVVHTSPADAADPRFVLGIVPHSTAREQDDPDRPRLVQADFPTLINQLSNRPGPVSDAVLEVIEQELGVMGHGLS